MKRDLKKWLKSDVVKEYIDLDPDLIDEDATEEDYCIDLLSMCESESEITEDQIVQFIWCEAQKQFLKNILDDIDNSIDRLFKGKDMVKGDKAQFVAYESSVKQWLYNKYHYLKRKNN